MEPRRYRFGPHPHAGWILGLRGSQVAGVAVAGVFAIALLRVGGLLSVALVGAEAALAGLHHRRAVRRAHRARVGPGERPLRHRAQREPDALALGGVAHGARDPAVRAAGSSIRRTSRRRYRSRPSCPSSSCSRPACRASAGWRWASCTTSAPTPTRRRFAARRARSTSLARPSAS